MLLGNRRRWSPQPFQFQCLGHPGLGHRQQVLQIGVSLGLGCGARRRGIGYRYRHYAATLNSARISS
jgi:hypothetical protein